MVTSLTPDHYPALAEVLERAKAVGFLGPGPVTEHIDHARVFHRALAQVLDPASLAATDQAPDQAGAGGAVGGVGSPRFADIGAGGGVPSLPLLVASDYSAVLLEAAAKRCSFLTWAAAELGLAERVEVWCGRVEELAHQERARFRFDAVVARGFGPPAATVECAVGLLVDGGHLIVSEPPGQRRWPVEALGELGLVQVELADPVPEVATFQRRSDVNELPADLPRGAKQQRSRPLFTI